MNKNTKNAIMFATFIVLLSFMVLVLRFSVLSFVLFVSSLCFSFYFIRDVNLSNCEDIEKTKNESD